MVKRLLAVAFVLALGFAFVGCGNDEPQLPEPPDIEDVEVPPPPPVDAPD